MKDQEQNNNVNKHVIVFFKACFDKNGKLKNLDILRIGLIKLLKALNFARYKQGDEYIIVRIIGQILSKASKEDIIDTLEEFIKEYIPEEICFDPNDPSKIISKKTYDDAGNPIYIVYRTQIHEKLLKGLDTFFSNSMLYRVRIKKNIVINIDTNDKIFFYFRNGFVECTKDTWKIKDYSQMDNYIFQDQIIDKEFIFYDGFVNTENEATMPVFGRFMFRVSGNDPQRFASLITITGYTIHQFTEVKMKAVVLTDSQLSDNAEGRTGKTLYAKAISKVRPLVEINGKNFNPSDKHRYSQCQANTNVAHVNDINENLPLKIFYNDITEGIVVDKKNEQPFTIRVKLILSTNATIEINGASDRDRCIEFEFADHYSDKYSPADEFGHWFFRDWSAEEWNKFFNFLCYCCKNYLAQGIISPKTINLEQRKLRKQTCQEFIDFMSQDNFQEVVNGIENTQLEQLHSERKYNVKTLLNRFKTVHSDFGHLDQRTFNKWLKLYADLDQRFETFRESTDWYKSNGNYFIVYREQNTSR